MQTYFDLFNQFTTKDYKVDETESGYSLNLNLAGFSKKNISIDFVDSHLVIEASQGTLEESFYKKFLVKNYHKIDIESISAELKLGVLSVVLPKKDSAKTKITVK
jgi:HSP20 family molecular chaperone IbpA